MASSLSWVPQFEWVSSQLNLADPISRGDLSVVQEDWKRLVTGTDSFERLLGELHTLGADEAVSRTLQLQWRWEA